MRYLIVIMLIGLTGCESTSLLKEKWPVAPASLMKKCDDLKLLPEDIKLSDLAKNITNNYALYHQCASKNEAWMEWYKEQKKIFEEAHK